jgi:hypothetical protein
MEGILWEGPPGTAGRAVVNFFGGGVQVTDAVQVPLGPVAADSHHAICNTLFQTHRAGIVAAVRHIPPTYCSAIADR